MSQCESSQESWPPPEADPNQVRRVTLAYNLKLLQLGSTAQSNVDNNWRIHPSVLRKAVYDHIETHKRKVYLKYDEKCPGQLLESHLQANVELFEDREIYVEMVLKKNAIVILYAHDHFTKFGDRLPQ